jgi:UDP-glucose 4-epimerase
MRIAKIPFGMTPAMFSDLGQVMEAMAGADAVIHLAAIHNPNIATAGVTYETNVVGTFNAASCRLPSRRQARGLGQQQCGRRLELRRTLRARLPSHRRRSPAQAGRVYGLSKEIGETIARSYARKEVETVSLRPSGVVTADKLEQIPSSIADRWLGLVQPGVEIRIGLSLRYWSC